MVLPTLLATAGNGHGQKMQALIVEAPFEEAEIQISELGGLVGFVGEYVEIPNGRFSVTIQYGGGAAFFRLSVGPDGTRSLDSRTLVLRCTRPSPNQADLTWRVRTVRDPAYYGVTRIVLDAPEPAAPQHCLSSLQSFDQSYPAVTATGEGDRIMRTASFRPPPLAPSGHHRVMIKSDPAGARVFVGSRALRPTPVPLSIPLNSSGRPVQQEIILVRMPQGLPCRWSTRDVTEQFAEQLVCHLRLPGAQRNPQR